jgi:hypothetical protein
MATEGTSSWRWHEGSATARRRPREGNRTPANEKNHGEIVWVHNFCFCQVNNREPLEIDSFYLCHIYLGVGKLHVLPNIKYKTVGVALIASRLHLMPLSAIFVSDLQPLFNAPLTYLIPLPAGN